MEAQAIYESLKGKFSESVGEFHGETFDPYIVIDKAAVRQVIGFLRDESGLEFNMLLLISGVDWKDRFEVVYHLTSLKHLHRVTLKAVLPHEDPHIHSITPLYRAADWHERETYDLLGIVFNGHPDMRRILLPEDWEGHPLRKDYVFPEEYHGVSNR